MTADVITLDDVRKSFGDFVAVDRADFSIREGEFFSLLGPSGCGKTTLLKMIAGFERPTSGRVLLDGADVSRVPPHKRNVNTVFQQYALFPHMNVADNVRFGPKSKKTPKADYEPVVTEMLDIVRLSEFANRKPDQLSGGQQQRVALARALVNHPRALLLDEPLAALDLKLREAMQFELKRIQREVGITFAFVTHDQGEALTMSDRIAVMNDGAIEQIGSPEEIYHRPSSLFVAGFIGAANLLSGTTAGSDGHDTVVELVTGQRVRATAHDDYSSGTQVSLMLRPERLAIGVEPCPHGRSLQGTVADVVFQGSTARVNVAIDATSHVVVTITTPTDLPFLLPGAVVHVTWSEASSYLLRGWSDDTAGGIGATRRDRDETDHTHNRDTLPVLTDG